jgi:hypothetical protein
MDDRQRLQRMRTCGSASVAGERPQASRPASHEQPPGGQGPTESAADPPHTERPASARAKTVAYVCAVAVALSCFVVGDLAFSFLAGVAVERADLDRDIVESVGSYVVLGSIGIGAVIGMRAAALTGCSSWVIVAVGTFLGLLVLLFAAGLLWVAFDEPYLSRAPSFAVLAGTIAWLLVRDRQPTSRVTVAAAIGVGALSMLVLLSIDGRSTDWLLVAIPAAVVTVLLIAWGIARQRSLPTRRWPVVTVGLAAGLVAGLAILQASWAESRWPHRRGLTDAVAASAGAVLVVVGIWAAFEPPFGLGPMVESGRIERPASGYALTLPDPWRIEDVSDRHELFGETAPDGTAVDLMAVCGESEAIALVMAVEDDMQLDPGATAAFFRLGFSLDPEYSEVESVVLSLPAGETARLDVVYRDAMAMSVYVFAMGERGYRVVQFAADEPPEDRWLSVAETFERLTVDEDASAGSTTTVRS